jgi:RNA-splicing ligase RtcB
MEIQGKYEKAIVYTDTVESSALDQVRALCDQPFAENTHIRIMPDVHAGAGCVIGFTANVLDAVNPLMVGVDVGCGVMAVNLGKAPLDLPKLDGIIHRNIPSGKHVHSSMVVPKSEFMHTASLRCASSVDLERAGQSLGTLGGGRDDCHRVG